MLDDELNGTKAAENQVKKIFGRKSDREGHSADLMADALVRILFAQRHRYRERPQLEAVRKLFYAFCRWSWRAIFEQLYCYGR